jgi:hypothetical protein
VAIIDAPTSTVDSLAGDTAYSVFQSTNGYKANSVIVGNFFFGITANGVLVFDGLGIPPNSTILSATLYVTAVANNGAPFTLDIQAIGGTPLTIGQVWSDDSFTGWRKSVWSRFRTLVRNTAAASIFDSDPGSNPAASWALNFEGQQRRSLGVEFSVGSAETLGSIELLLSRTGNPVGSDLVVDLHNVATNIYGVVEPTGPAIASSDPVTLASVPAVRAFVPFAFSGPNQIGLTAGTPYIAVIREPDYPVNGVDFINWHDRRAFLTIGISKFFGTGNQFDYQLWPLHGDLSPIATFNRIGSPITWVVPTFVIGFEFNTGLTNIGPVIQDAVSDAGYHKGRRIALVLDAAGESANRRFAAFGHPTYSPARLDVQYVSTAGKTNRLILQDESSLVMQQIDSRLHIQDVDSRLALQNIDS